MHITCPVVCGFFEILTFLLVKSFIDLVHTLIRENPGKYILSEKFSQYFLEQHFGKHRRSGGCFGKHWQSDGCSGNPQLDVFMQLEVAVGLLNSDLISNFKGIIHGRPDTRPPVTMDDTQLPVKHNK